MLLILLGHHANLLQPLDCMRLNIKILILIKIPFRLSPSTRPGDRKMPDKASAVEKLIRIGSFSQKSCDAI